MVTDSTHPPQFNTLCLSISDGNQLKSSGVTLVSGKVNGHGYLDWSCFSSV